MTLAELEKQILTLHNRLSLRPTLQLVQRIGQYLIGAISQRDFTVIQGVVVISASIVIISNLLVDFTYPLLDPRIRYA